MGPMGPLGHFGAILGRGRAPMGPHGPPWAPRGLGFPSPVARGHYSSQGRFFPPKNALLGPPGGWDFQVLLLGGGVPCRGIFSPKKYSFGGIWGHLGQALQG